MLPNPIAKLSKLELNCSLDIEKSMSSILSERVFSMNKMWD